MVIFNRIYKGDSIKYLILLLITFNIHASTELDTCVLKLVDFNKFMDMCVNGTIKELEKRKDKITISQRKIVTRACIEVYHKERDSQPLVDCGFF